MTVRMTWYGDQFKRMMADEMNRRLKKSGITIKNKAKEGLSRSQPTRGTGAKKRGLDPSKSGEYPKKVIGHLRRNIQEELNPSEKKERVGTNVPYGRYLELGTKKMARRPWLTLAVNQSRQEIKNILEKPVK